MGLALEKDCGCFSQNLSVAASGWGDPFTTCFIRGQEEQCVPALTLTPCLRSSTSAVQNGLLVVNMLVDNHHGLAEQLVSCGIHSALQSCCQGGQNPAEPSCPSETLATAMLSRLVEHKVPSDLATAGTESSGSFRPHCL